MTYTQCVLRNKNKTTVSWIPSKFAVNGTSLKLKIDDVWEDKWVVISVGATTDMPPDAHIGIKQHRKNTGDSLPK